MRTLTSDIKPRTIPIDQLNALAQELAWIRAAGFATITRIDRFYRRVFTLARNRHLDASEVYSRLCSMSLEISQDDARAYHTDLASQARRKAV